VNGGSWPAGAALCHRIEIGATLALALEVENRGPVPIRLEDALHTYLAVRDVERVRVTGLEGATFLDETEGCARKRAGAEPRVLRGETDRVYDDTRTACVVWDPRAHRRVEIATSGSAATVVWNPGPERPRILADLGDDDWRRFVCVESGNVGRGAVTVAPGAGHRLSIRIQSEPWDGA